MACGTRPALSTLQPSTQGQPLVACGHTTHQLHLWPPCPSARALLHSRHPTGWDSTVPVPLMRPPRLLEGQGPTTVGWEVAGPHWPGHTVLCSDGSTAASPHARPCPCGGSSLFLYSIQVIGQEHFLPPTRPRDEGGALSGAVGKGPGHRGLLVLVWLEQGVSWGPGPAGGRGGARGAGAQLL